MEYKVGNQVILATDDDWNGLYGVIENIFVCDNETIYAIFCVPMVAFGHYFARESNLSRAR